MLSPCTLPSSSLYFFLPAIHLRSVEILFPEAAGAPKPPIQRLLIEQLATLEQLEVVRLDTGDRFQVEEVRTMNEKNKSDLQWQFAEMLFGEVRALDWRRRPIHHASGDIVPAHQLADSALPSPRHLSMVEYHPGSPSFVSSDLLRRFSTS